jgi:peptide/nickel transport system substrate-binding protein
MKVNTWTGLLNYRIRRRRALTAAGAAGAGALLLACGSKEKKPKTAYSTGIVSKLTDTTNQARRGGILKDRAFGDPPTLDPFNANNPQNAIGPMVFGALLQFKPGHLKPAEGDVMGDLAESWEWSPDGLQVTLRLRQGTKWHNKAPVNGRAFDTEDVMFSWNRFVAKSSGRANVANSADPAAPVLSLSTPDARTVVIKLKEPVIYALALFAFNRSGGTVMLPKETDSTFDARNDMIGTNAFMLSNYTPSVSFTLKRHPEHYDKDHALVDQVNFPIIPEYAAALSQFKAGNIYTMGSRSPGLGVRQEEILTVKQEEPRLQIVASDLLGSGSIMVFGFLPGSPFHDERVRQAVSMSWDRDLYIDTLNNVSKFRSQGLDVEMQVLQTRCRRGEEAACCSRPRQWPAQRHFQLRDRASVADLASGGNHRWDDL